MKNKKDYKITILYFLGMIFIVSGHISGGGISLLYNWFPVYSFHLALFAFCSGYLYNNKSENDIKQYIVKKIKKLIIPLYIFNFLYAILVIILEKFGFTIGIGGNLIEKLTILPITNGHQFLYNMGGWFVIPLFTILVFNVCMKKLYSRFKMKNMYLYIFYIVLGIFGVYLASKGYNKGLYLVLVRSLYLLQFFAVGLLYKEYLEKYDKLNNLLYFMIVFSVALLLIFIYGKTPTYIPSWSNNYNNGPIMPLIVGLLGISFWLRVSKILVPIIGKSKIVNTIADSSYYIMIHQFIGFMMVKTVFYILYLITPRFNNFNINSFKTDIWYLYLPKDISQFEILYLIAGLLIPIIIKKLIEKSKFLRRFL